MPAELREAALISVYDRTGIVELAQTLVGRGVTIFATGGTRAHLAEHGIAARDVGELTGFPELFDGRVKTLHPSVFGGILFDRSNPAHEPHGTRIRSAKLSSSRLAADAPNAGPVQSKKFGPAM